MDPHIFSHPPISNNGQRMSPVFSHSEVITPAKPKTKAPGREDSGALHQPGNLMSGTLSGGFHAPGVFQKSSHLPTPRSPCNISHHVTRNSNSDQNFQLDVESTALPTEFRSYASPSPPALRPYSIPTPESSPLVAWSRSIGPHSMSQGACTNYGDIGSTPPGKRPSTPPRTPSRQTSTRPVTPVMKSRPSTPSRQGPTEQLLLTSTGIDGLRCGNSAASCLLRNVKDEPEAETARIRAQLIENHLTSAQAAESRRPDYLKRVRRPTSSSSIGAGGAPLTSDLGGQDGSLLWSSTNVGVIESPVKGKRIALFQETSEESFEESLMAGGYGRYRSGRPWKLDEGAEVPNLVGGTVGEEEFGSKLVSKEDEKRKKTRLAAFLDPPQVTSSIQLFPVEIKGCGRVLMKVEPSEPQTLIKSTSKAKKSRKRKKTSADMKLGSSKDSIAAPEDRAVDGPNWPDTEFPWRSRSVAQDGISSVEREERLRHIESFLDRNSDEDDVEERYSSSRRSPDEGPSRSPRLGRGKSYPLLSHSRDHQRGTTMLSVIPCDPADARTALLSKKSIRAVRLRLLRRRDANRGADNDDGKVLCVCRGRDDGRPLVQCDACRTWYHLACIGIRSTSELGREEDPWFCANCAEVKMPLPVAAPLTGPTFASMDDDEHGIGRRGSADVDGYDPPFLIAGLNLSPATPWTRSVRPPTTPPRTQYAPHSGSGSAWDEAPSSSSRGDPRTPQFDTASAFGDMVRVYGMTPGCSLEASSSTVKDESPFDPTSTPSRGIRFGLPFTTPKDGKWGSSSWQGSRSGEWFHTPKHPGEDGSATCLRYGQPLLYRGRVGDVSEEGPSGVPGLLRATGPNTVTPVEREVFGLKRMQLLESPLGVKRSKRRVDP